MERIETISPKLAKEPQSTKKSFPFKLVAIVVSIILLVTVIIYFLSSSSKNEETSSGGQITWWGLWEDETVLAPLISEYEAQNPKIKIKYVRQSKEDYRERLTNALAKGSGPDIFRFHNTWVPMYKSELDKVPQSIYTVSEFSETFYPVSLSDLTVGSNLVGLPLEYDTLLLYINEDIFEKAGKSVPATWNELRQTARELTILDEQGSVTQSGVALGRTENVDHWPEILGLMMLQNGVDLTKPTGKLAEDALDFYTIFGREDGVWDATLPSSTVSFAGGNLAMYFGPSWRAHEIRMQNPNLKFKTVAVPQLPKTEANEADVSYASYWVEGVWSRSKNKSEAWKFLKFLSSKSSLSKFYTQTSKTRMFGEPFSRKDMKEVLADHPIIGSVVQSGDTGQTWFLQSKTWDGATGINSQINKYFEDAVNLVNSGKESKIALEPVAQGVIQVLSQYGIKVQ